MGSLIDRLVLAVDGGNSKTDAVLVTEHGRLIGYAKAPGSSPHKIGVQGSIQLIDGLVRDLREQAGLDPETRIDRAELYLAGADLPAEVSVLRREVAATGWAASSVVDNDGYAILRAGTRCPNAVAVVCGSGINCVGRRADGRTAQFPSLGRTTGDWGGGVHIGYEALWYAARAEDGRGRPTALRDAVADHFGCATVADVGEAMHVGSISERRVGDLAAVLFAVADDGDAVAEAVVARLVEEIAVLVEVTVSRLEPLDGSAVVVLGGGVIRARHDTLLPLVRAKLGEHVSTANIVAVTDAPVLGAALSGLDVLGAGMAAEERVADEIRRVLPFPATALRSGQPVTR